MCCATGPDGEWRGAYADDDGERLALPDAVAEAVALSERVGDHEVEIAPTGAVARLAPTAKRAVVATSANESDGRVVLVVLREGSGNSGARSRIETLAAFAHNAALIVSNARLHEERELAFTRQVDLNRQKSDFVAAVSHELRTPLAVMLGSVHTLDRLDGRMTDEQREQLFAMTVEQGGRLQRLIDELLLVAAAEHADVQLQSEPIEVSALFTSVGEAAAAAVRADHLVVAPNDVGTVVCDPSKVERVLLNLVENAAKYAPDAPIELRADRVGVDSGVGAELRLSVIDHGPGIPAADRTRVFERFVQLDQSSTRRQGGTGLGLHLCKQLADLIDGHMTLEETPGGGCTFALTIPCDPVASTAPTEADANPFGNVLARPAEFGGVPLRVVTR